MLLYLISRKKPHPQATIISAKIRKPWSNYYINSLRKTPCLVRGRQIQRSRVLLYHNAKPINSASSIQFANYSNTHESVKRAWSELSTLGNQLEGYASGLLGWRIRLKMASAVSSRCTSYDASHPSERCNLHSSSCAQRSVLACLARCWDQGLGLIEGRVGKACLARRP